MFLLTLTGFPPTYPSIHFLIQSRTLSGFNFPIFHVPFLKICKFLYILNVFVNFVQFYHIFANAFKKLLKNILHDNCKKTAIVKLKYLKL